VTRRQADVRWPLRDRLFGIDPRALAWFRICIGGIVLVDLFDRAADLERHYTDAGVLPRADLARLFGFSRWYWSLHLLSGSVAGQAAPRQACRARRVPPIRLDDVAVDALVPCI